MNDVIDTLMLAFTVVSFCIIVILLSTVCFKLCKLIVKGTKGLK